MSQHGTNGSTPTEELIMVHAGIYAVGAVLGSAGAAWLLGVQWLIDHQVLVAAAAAPLLPIPGADGAGLDLPRLCISVAVLLASLVVFVSWICRQVADRRAAALM